MDQADKFLREIDQFQALTGQSDRAISMGITGKPDLVRKVRESRRLPKGDNLAAAATYLNVPISRLIGLDEQPTETVVDRRIAYRPDGIRNDLPIQGTALGHNLSFDTEGGAEIEDTIFDPGEPIRHINRPAVLEGVRGAYAVYIQGESMSPRYEPGELAVVDPRKTAQLGDDVIVQLYGDPDTPDHDQVVSVLIKRLVRRSASWVELRQFNPDVRFKVDAARVRSIHRIVPIGDMLGA